MGARVCIFLAAFCQLITVLPAQQRAMPVPMMNASASAIYITNVTVIDTETGNEAQNRTVIVSGDRILGIRDSKNTKPPAGARDVDGTNKYLIPGLWDMHTHAVRAQRMKSMFSMFVVDGVLGIHDMGTDLRAADVFLSLLRTLTAQGQDPFKLLACPDF
jgi:imidazolonepropionase-like amidohydrolase